MKYSEIKEITNKLRKNMTPAEKLLWANLRKHKLGEGRFLRQYPIFYDRNFSDVRFFVADFYCPMYKLVVELDGKIHDYQQEHDRHRDEIIEWHGMKVLRIKNEELKDIRSVIAKIKTFMK